MVTNTVTIEHICTEGHKWKQEMTRIQLWEFVKSKKPSLDCPFCRYGDVNIVPTEKDLQTPYYENN